MLFFKKTKQNRKKNKKNNKKKLYDLTFMHQNILLSYKQSMTFKKNIDMARKMNIKRIELTKTI